MADQNITALPQTTAPEASDQLMIVGATEEKLIDYEKLADAILTKLTSKTFALNQGTMTLLQALNELNSNLLLYDIGAYCAAYTFLNFLKEKHTYGLFILTGYEGYLFSDLPDNLSQAVNIITYKGARQDNGQYSQGLISDSLGHRYTFAANNDFTEINFKAF